jgi:hypothetical protein
MQSLNLLLLNFSDRHLILKVFILQQGIKVFD